jgi:hypothetical protein
MPLIVWAYLVNG